MAEAFLGIVYGKLRSLVENEFAHNSGRKQTSLKLLTALTVVWDVLEYTEEAQKRRRVIKDDVKRWLKEAEDTVYMLDDVLDEYSIESPGLAILSSLIPKSIIFHRRLKEIAKRFHELGPINQAFLYLRREGDTSVEERLTEVARWSQTRSSLVVAELVYGRVEYEENIVEFLLRQARDSDSLSIYPIVGMGGVGKTTLAQLVYNDARVSSHFDIKIWVVVSGDFDIKRILYSIIKSITTENYDVLDLDHLIESKVQELLQSKRYLLVLDDVLEADQDKWNKLKSVLSCGSKGASILVTTRSHDVAKIMGTCQAHHLSRLSDDDCWSLFKHYAFGPGQEEPQEELVAIGKEIVKNCEGLPFAATVLGKALYSRSEKEWLEVEERMFCTSPDEDSILTVLRLSYSNLTPKLKLCFAFCAIFPKETEIMKEDLIHLWMANGFISSSADMDVEDVGDEIFNKLCQAAFFQVMKMDGSEIISFAMHDRIHDLAQSIMGEECIILENAHMTILSRSTHHVGFGSGQSFSKLHFMEVASLRTLYQLEFDNTISGSFPTIGSLRVLCTSSFNLSSLRNLVHLRYLELHGFEIKTLPDSIYSLRKLEILKLKKYPKLSCLPKRLTCLQKLRHLVINDCDSLSRMFPNIRKLSYLRTLSVFIVSLETGFSLAELDKLDLGGKLCIQGLQNVGSICEAQEANLMAKTKLQELCLSWDYSGQTESHVTIAEQVLEGLKPHSNLKRLKIYGYEGSHFPSWMRNNSILSSLVALELFDCKKCGQLPPLGKLPYLRKLEIQLMKDVLYMDDDSYNGVEVAFPSLEELEVRGLPKLERLLKVETGEMFPRLSDLVIWNCPMLRLPYLPSIKRLRVGGCNNKFLSSISSFNSLTFLDLSRGEDLTFFPEGMMTNLTSLETLMICDFPKLKKLPDELIHLDNLVRLEICSCCALESFPEQVWSGLRSLRALEITYCGGLRSLPEGLTHLSPHCFLKVEHCPALKTRVVEETGDDWHKIAHIQKRILFP